MLPPPTPFKLFVLAAAVSEMQFSHFLLAIFAGRFVRFLVLSLLTLKSVLEFVRVSGSLFHDHPGWGAVGDRGDSGDRAGGVAATRTIRVGAEDSCWSKASASISNPRNAF